MKTLLLTGASGDIGKAIQKLFEKNNYRIIAPTRAELNLESPESIQHYFKNFKEKIDSLIHCAGFNTPKLALDLNEADVQKTFQINTMAFYSICRQLLNHFVNQKGASILAISSIYGHFSRKGRLAYATSKHALEGMVKTLALEFGIHNIKVNCLAPGFVDTQLTRKNNSEEIIEGFKQKIPLGRLADPMDIAEVAYFLCSENNKYINGQSIIVDGGYSVGGFQE